MTHFEVFGLTPSVELDLPALEAKYRALALATHPDRQAGADAKARVAAADKTATLNDAFKVLKDPERRAFYLLKLHGVDLDREDAGAQKDMPLEFLEEVLDRREGLDDAKAHKDLGRVRKMAEEVAALRGSTLKQAQVLLARLLVDPSALKEASVALGRVRYFTRFLEEVDAIEEEALS